MGEETVKNENGGAEKKPAVSKINPKIKIVKKAPEVRAKPGRKYKAKLLDEIPVNAREVMQAFKLSPKPIKKKPRFSKSEKMQLVYFTESYNLLQYFFVAKRYIMAKYKLKTFQSIELFLYLYPKNWFTQEDYKLFPTPLVFSRLESMVKNGHISYFVKRHKKADCLYQLSDRSKRMVEDFYNVLAGNKVVDLDKFYTLEEKKVRSRAAEMTQRLIRQLEGGFDFQEEKKIYYKEARPVDTDSPESD